ncbi:rho GTPase-activating protein 23-like isoform X3 [Amphibalanus amphitrite]|uniref:rho GTPase-activating protein 23-like isoform X3 n=1 Tax=Amphibalanus amphitrite TaxID=1232801 RepID=UPI001C91028E|nr:rho GTPase-activating protein 23-like isoform X3 [Amphibalanus amphitrite]
MAGLTQTDDYSDYAYNGDYEYDGGSLAASDATGSGAGSVRYRQVVLERRSPNEGFGFTLRHFIAYPEDGEVEVEPPGFQETIFVSNVAPGGPAYHAGLQIGDRVVDVNGLPTWDLSYADVVYQVQLSGLRLVLKVQSRDDDEIQRNWSEFAHHPASNLNIMKPFSHLPRPPPYRPAGGTPLPLGALSQAAVAVATPHLTSDDSASLNGERSGSSRRPSTLSMPSLQMPPSMSGSAASGLGSEHADTSDPVVSRILKDVETKQQFLRQPAQQWPAAQPQTPVVREYHVNPARFPRPPWPPEASAAPAGGAPRLRPAGEQERRRRWQRGEPATAPAGRAGQPPVFPAPRGTSLSVSSSTDSLSSLPAGVPNATARPYSGPESASSSSGAPEYVQYDAVTQVPRAKVPPPDHRTHIVSKRARQFETGCVDNDTFSGPSGYRSELSLIAEPGKRASVRRRRDEFERDPDASDYETSGAEEAPRRPPRSGIGNRMVIVGGPRLHAEPLNEGPYRADGPQKKAVRRRPEPEPAESAAPSSWPFCAVDAAGRPLSKISEAEQEASPENERKRNSAEIIAGKVEEKKHKESMAAALRSRTQHRALRQPSYMAAVQTPTPEARPSPPVVADGAAAAGPAPLPSPGDGPRPRRPDYLPLTACHRAEAAPAPAPAAADTAPAAADVADTADTEDSVLAGDPDTKSPPIRSAAISPPLEPGKTSTPNALANAARRQKPFAAGGEDDPDRAVRRISYIKATAGDGLFHTGGKEDRKPGKLSLSFQPDRKASELPPKGRIQKLRNFFEEKAQNQLKRLERSASTRGLKPSSPTWPSSPPASGPAADATREGWLRVKLAMVDGKRAPDRSWRELWAVLRGDALSFYRDRKEVNQTPSSLEEQPVNVALCQLDTAEDYTRRKNVFRLQTHTMSEYLLQTEHVLERERWLEALRPICQLVQHEDSSRSVNDSTLLSPSSVIRAKLTNRQRSPTGLAPHPKPRKQSQTTEQMSDSPKSKSWRGRMKRQIMKIHPSSAQMPPATAAPDGATLSVPLEQCPPSESNPFVPRIVELCTGLVEKRGLDSEGIYRVPGNNAAIKSLSAAVNRGIYEVDLQADPRWTDVNVISSLLKLFLRQLPDSLVTSELYPKFIDTSKIEDPERRRHLLRELVNRLPDHNYETLKHLLRHLRRVTDPANNNKMDLKNLAIVFGPTLVRSSDDSTTALVTDMSQQCGIVKTLISELDYYFPPEEADETGDDQPPPLPESSPPLSAEILDGPARHAPPLFSTAHRLDNGHHKELVSSIISAASRKVQQQDSRSERDETGSEVSAAPSLVGRPSECNNNQLKPAPSSLYGAGAAETAPAAAAAGGPAHRVHVIPIRLVEEAPAAAAAPAPAAAVPGSALSAARQRLSSESASAPSLPVTEPAVQDDTAIRSYAGLSETTQERIRRFEEETRAMLQRDKLREREARDLDLQRQRIEREWARAKQDLEHPDFLDELADNPAVVARRIAELSTKLPGLTPSAAITAAAAAADSADRDERLSLASESAERRPPSAWDTVSSGYSTMSSAGTGPRPSRARADSLPLRPAAPPAAPPAPPASAESGAAPREPRRASESGERSRWLAASGRLYRSPRPARRRGSAEDLTASQTRKVELKRSEMALKARPAAHRGGSTSRDESSSADESAAVSPAPVVSAGPPPPTPAADAADADPLAAHESCDMVASLVQTLDQKLQALGGRTAPSEQRAARSNDMYRDPSLHRSYSASSQLQMMNGSAGGERSAPAAPTVRSAPRPAPAELTKKTMKRSIRQLCDQFEQRETPRSARAAPGSPRALKRRHTVGGSKDIDKVVRLVLAASRAGPPGPPRPAVRPASCLVELDLLPLQPVPLESRV